MAIPGFLFGGETGLTQDQLSQRRRVLEAMLARGVGAPRNVGEGLTAIGNALAYRFGKNQLAGQEKAAQEKRSQILAPLFGGGGGDNQLSPGVVQSSGMPSPEAASEMSATTPASFSGNQQEFIQSILPAAVEEGQRTGVDPRIIVAQAAQETGWGKSAPGNNLFGIKSHGQDGGNSLMTTEYVDGQPVKTRDSFRAYGNPADSVRGYGDFILQNPRYEPFRTAQGLDAQLEALGKSGYATDPNYSQSVGRIARGIQLPNEVASLDPSSGMTPASAAIEQQAPGSGYVDPQVTTDYRAPQPQAGAGSALPPLPVTNVGPSPNVASVPPAREAVANALTGQPQRSAPTFSPAVTAVGDAMTARNQPPAAPPVQMAQSGPSMQQLYQAYSSPDITDVDRSMIGGMIQQRQREQMQANDPLRQLQMQKLQREINAPLKRETTTVNGRLVDSQTGQVIADFPDQTKPTADRQNYEYYRDFEVRNNRTPLGPLEWEQAQRKAGATNVTTNVGEGDKFYENLDKKNAETFAAMSDSGMQARANLGRIDRLEGLMANAPQGAVGALKQAAGEWGIPTEGVSDIQAASALLEKMVPEQRAPGTGPMSDADIKMFRASLPRILNQPGGNQLIFQTMRGITQYEIQMGEIADQVADRVITPAEGRKLIREMKNPLADFKIPEGPTPNEGRKTSTGVQWSVD